MKSFASICCLLLHLTTAVFASPVSEDLTPVHNASNQPAPTSAVPTPFTFTSPANSQQSGSRADQIRQARNERQRTKREQFKSNNPSGYDNSRKAYNARKRLGRKELKGNNPSGYEKLLMNQRNSNRKYIAKLRAAKGAGTLAERNAIPERLTWAQKRKRTNDGARKRRKVNTESQEQVSPMPACRPALEGNSQAAVVTMLVDAAGNGQFHVLGHDMTMEDVEMEKGDVNDDEEAAKTLLSFSYM